MKKAFALLLSILMLLSLCACGSSQSAKGANDYAAPAEMPMAEPEMAMDEAADYGGFAVLSFLYKPIPMPP